MTFEYSVEELGLDEKISPKFLDIRRLRPLDKDQPWGVFFIAFDETKLPVVALKRLLSKLALTKRSTSNTGERASWNSNDLLLISQTGTNNGKSISFAHFASNPAKTDLPILKVLGWDSDDTGLKVDYVIQTLREKLVWPDDPSDSDAWRSQWREAFALKNREVIQSSKEMAERLGHLALAVRTRLREVLAIESEEGPIHKLMSVFKENLISDLDSNKFSDMYAQTIAYGLLSARIINPKVNTVDAAHTQIPITNPFLKELMETFLNVGGRNHGSGVGLDFDELGINEVVDLLDNTNMEAVLRDFGDRNQKEDPVMHFFEGFLQEYDSKIRKDRGVFYTPQPVVSFIVRSVDEQLRTEFGLEDGLADTTTWAELAARIKDLEIPEDASPNHAFVRILDPATGTGTFPVEVIDLIYKTMTEKWRLQGNHEAQIKMLWNEYVPKHLLPRLHGYELMMAPYAIAHMKIGLKLYETGYQFKSDQRARIYLTNALEPAKDFSGSFAFAIPALARESKAVNTIKRDCLFTVVIGNPPYSSLSQNMGDWITELISDFRKIDGDQIYEKGKRNHLQDDYVKFLRLGLAHIERSGVGICGFITNHSYVYSPTFRAMRNYISRTINLGKIIELNGDIKRGDAKEHPGDENVFDIQQGVAIGIFCNSTGEKNHELLGCTIFGDRQYKYKYLEGGLSNLEFTNLYPNIPFYSFQAEPDGEDISEYDSWSRLDVIMPFGGTGIKTNRDGFSIAFSEEALRKRAAIFSDEKISDNTAQELLGLKENYTWKISDQRQKFRMDQNEDCVRDIEYRPFDTRKIYYQKNIVFNPRFETMAQARANNVFLLSCRQQYAEGFQHVFATRKMFECCLVSNKSREITSGFPLFVNPPIEHDLLQPMAPKLNFSDDFLATLTNLNVFIIEEEEFDIEQQADFGYLILGYIYGILSSKKYRERYASKLKLDFPHIPLTKTQELFSSIAELGKDLLRCHLLENIESSLQAPKFNSPVGDEIEKVSYSDGTVWINRSETTGFHDVSEDVWNFRIGSYQVCEKWLKDRQAKTGKAPRPGHLLTNEDVKHYQKIVVTLSETIRIMAEIDEVIEAHGGWPDAFSKN